MPRRDVHGTEGFSHSQLAARGCLVRIAHTSSALKKAQGHAIPVAHARQSAYSRSNTCPYTIILKEVFP